MRALLVADLTPPDRDPKPISKAGAIRRARAQGPLAAVRPVGGGSYAKTCLGNEICNFNATAEDASTRERIVGWYRNAKLLRVWQGDPTGQPQKALVTAENEKTVLLPTLARTHAVPRGKGGIGQANLRYLYDNHGKLSAPEWMKKAISYMESYKGENLLTDPLAEMTGAGESELVKGTRTVAR
ncbi:MAG: hypothetical protein ABSG65_12850 [Bryobacteraceae bacterium]|jgi:hypothetical protein